MKLNRRQLRKIILQEIMQGGPEPMPGMIGMSQPGDIEIDGFIDSVMGTMSKASGFTDAISKMKNGESFSIDVPSGPTGPALESAAAGAGGLLSRVDPKILLAIGGVIVIIILVAMALKYNIKISASKSTSSERPGGIKDSDEKSMEVVFEAPPQAQS